MPCERAVGSSVASKAQSRVRAGSFADKLVKEAKRKAAQEQLDNVQLVEHVAIEISWCHAIGRRRHSNSGEPPHHKAWASFRNLKRVLTDTKLPKSLRLRLFRRFIASLRPRIVEVIRESMQKAQLNMFEILSRMTGREIADEARTPSINVLLRTRDLRWNWLGHILRIDERRTVRQVLLNCVKPTQE